MGTSPDRYEGLRTRYAARAERLRREQAPRIARAEERSARLGLGRLVGLYALDHRSPQRRFGAGVIAVSLIVGVVTLPVLVLVARSSPLILLVGVALFGAGVVAGALLISRGTPPYREEVAAFEGGIVREDTRGGAPEPTRWDDVAALHRLWAGVYDASSEESRPAFSGHRLQRSDGAVVELGSGYTNLLDPVGTGGRVVAALLPGGVAAAMPDFPGLREVVEREVTRRLLPAALAEFDAGRRVAFGPLAIGPAGVSVEGKPELVPWEQVDKLEVEVDAVVVRRRGHRFGSWARVDAAAVANLPVAEALIRERLGR